MNEMIKQTIANLEKNGMPVCFVETKQEVAAAVARQLPAQATVAVGGSVTLSETGVLDLLRRPEYRFLDRYAPGLTRKQQQEIFCQSLTADVFLTSANAITQAGELYNVDGNNNRIAAIAYGPKSVIVVAGINKIVPDLPAAIRRVKTVAAPRNAQRLNCDTFCRRTGHCVCVDGGMTDGCTSPGRICRNYLISGPQMRPGRIHIVLVGETCGY